MARFKDGLALILVGIVMAGVSWVLLHYMGMWFFYVFLALLVYVMIRRYFRGRKVKDQE